jgi:hypothetical protein
VGKRVELVACAIKAPVYPVACRATCSRADVRHTTLQPRSHLLWLAGHSSCHCCHAHAGIATRLFGSTSHNILGVTLVKSDGSVVGREPGADRGGR